MTPLQILAGALHNAYVARQNIISMIVKSDNTESYSIVLYVIVRYQIVKYSILYLLFALDRPFCV